MGEDFQGFARLVKGFTRIRENLGEDSQGIARLWERICKDLQDFVKGFTRIRENLGEYL